MAPRRLKVSVRALSDKLLALALTAAAVPIVLLLGTVAVPTHALKPLIGRQNRASLMEFFACARIFLWHQLNYQ